MRHASSSTVLAFLLPLAVARAQDTTASTAAAPGAAAPEKKEITLERLFPEKRFFGPSARGATISFDGHYGAFLWQPYAERRHGPDLWLFDFESGETRRLTSAVVLEPFRQLAHEVAEDRRARAKEKEKDKEKTEQKVEGAEGSTGAAPPTALEGEGDAGDRVDEDDADREDAPRWDGVSTCSWSPVANELLLVSGGDVYRWKAEGGGLERLTRTRDGESRVQWLPDGTGFLFQKASALMRVTFGDSSVVQIDPALPAGETLGDFELSPDGKKLAFVAQNGDMGTMAGNRTVKIADYDDRFMTVKEVPRHVSDDPLPARKSILYVWELPDGLREDGKLHRLHTHEHTGTRDVVQTPDWAPDSSRVTFGTFRQTDGQVEIREALLPVPEPAGHTWAALVARVQGKDPAAGVESGAQKEGEKQDEKKEEKKEERKDDGERERRREEGEGGRGSRGAPPVAPKVHELPARIVYRFLHQGGPNTPSMVEPRYAADSRHILFLTEQSGFRHLGRLDPLYESFDALTSGPFEVYPGAWPRSRAFAVVLATREGPERQDAYKIDLEQGGMTRLSSQPGRLGSIAISPDGGRLLGRFEAYGRLGELVAIDVAAGTQKDLTESHPQEARDLTVAVPELFRFQNRHGHELAGMLFKPEGWKAEDRRPALVYVYGGPLGTSKEVLQGSYSGSAYFFAWYMAQRHGYVTATIDTRGMSGYGAVFEKANFEQVGKPQVEDLVDGARWLVEHAGVDPARIGLHGWSFGGFQTQMCLYTEPEVFACGIAGAGPTEWENYNSWYSTGTIGGSRTGTPDLSKYSLLPLAKNLKRKLLLVHGMEDSNVLYQDTVRVYGELLKAGKETLVELFLDPSGGHGLGGHVKALGRYKKYEEFLLRCLGSGQG